MKRFIFQTNFYFIGIFRKQSKVAKHQNFFFFEKVLLQESKHMSLRSILLQFKKSFFVSPLAFQLEHSFDFIVSTALASFEALPQFHLKHCFRFMFVWIDVVTTVPLFEQVNFWRHQLYRPPRWWWRRPTGNGHFQLTEFDSNFNPTDGRTSKQS